MTTTQEALKAAEEDCRLILDVAGDIEHAMIGQKIRGNVGPMVTRAIGRIYEALRLIREARETPLTDERILHMAEEYDVRPYGETAEDRLIKLVRAAVLEAREGDIMDTQRLDFLDTMNAALNRASGTVYKWELIANHNVNRLMAGHLDIDLNDARAHGMPSCRAAIDLKMAEYKIRRDADPQSKEQVTE